jgi:hypothetical protein
LNHEVKLIEDGKYKREFVSSLYNHDENAIRYFSELVAFPQETGIEDSYSIIIEAVK